MPTDVAQRLIVEFQDRSCLNCMAQMPLVSTIIPAYNAEPFIREAVDSALAQTYGDQEIIVVDDGSTDGTAAILRSYGDKVRCIHQENRGVPLARNRGASHAHGEWLAFLDADDAWLPSKLQKQMAIATEHDVMVYTDRRNFGQVSHIAETGSATFSLHDGDLFEPLLYLNCITASSVMMRRSRFERLGGFDPAVPGCEDWDLWLRLSAADGIIRVVREPLTLYRWHSSSLSRDQRKMCKTRHRVLERALASPRGSLLPRSVMRRARAEVWKCSAWHAASWRRGVALRWYLRALRHNLFDLATYKSILKCCLGRA